MKFNVNNKRTLTIEQAAADGKIIVTTKSENKTDEVYSITPGDFVMLINLYKHTKDNDIQNDFINPYGKNKEE